MLLNIISDPNIAYMLLLFGFYGLFFELASPGAIFPGVVGGISLILAFASFQTLPVNYTGVLLIIFAIVLFILEVKIISHGVLAVGGIISMFLGSTMLFETKDSAARLSLWVILPSVVLTAVFFIVVIRLVVRAQKRPPVTGAEGLVGTEGKVVGVSDDSQYMVSLHGELWSASSDASLARGDRVVVEAVSGLSVKVRKTGNP